jgi:DNA-binding GntR family transcriptional regulator
MPGGKYRAVVKMFATPPRGRSDCPPDRISVIYRALRHAIIEQALAPGAKLPEDAIGERFGVSRIIVRSALSQLAADGLVELRRNHGASVATPKMGGGAGHQTF